MRQRLTIILTVIVILGALVVLNTITYVKKEKPLDTEMAPNRSTYHSGPTGTRALYDFLSESGHKVMRWRDATHKLLGDAGKDIKTLVVIDRQPDSHLLPKSGSWSVVTNQLDLPPLDLDPTDPKQMTEHVTALHP